MYANAKQSTVRVALEGKNSEASKYVLEGGKPLRVQEGREEE
jgi:hypothetical protein